MKLIVAVAVTDRVDRNGWRLDEKITIHKQDPSTRHVIDVMTQTVMAPERRRRAALTAEIAALTARHYQ
jgi:hypothetical protein